MHFDKYHACGNDFILLNQLQNAQRLSIEQVTRLCHRQFGIGADGIIVLKSWDEEKKILTLEIYNNDGSLASMCANGTRCAAHVMSKLLKQQGEFQIKTPSGLYTCQVEGERVWLKMTLESLQAQSIDVTALKVAFVYQDYFFANTGVPHSIFLVADTQKLEIEKLAPVVRHHPLFPQGCNVNFVTPSSESNKFFVRTFERGVEAETLSCGTGILAVALFLKNKKNATGEILFLTPGGELRAQIGTDYISYGGNVVKTFSGHT